MVELGTATNSSRKSRSKITGRGSSSWERITTPSSLGETENKRGLQITNATNNNDDSDDDDDVGDGGIKLTGILERSYWAYTIFEVTIDLLRDPNNGFFDEIFDPSQSSLREDTPITFELLHGGCMSNWALSSYWDAKPVQALIGGQCSSASIPLAYMGTFDNVPQISMTSTSVKLSDKSEFPNFSRVVSPDDERGQVGALVSTLDLFDWDRVAIINTDLPYDKDLATAFRGIWKGEVAYTGTINTKHRSRYINHTSAKQILKSASDSKVVVLLAQWQHAFTIFEISKSYFSKDTMWVGLDPSWTTKPHRSLYLKKANYYCSNADFPGFLVVVPYRQNPNKSAVYSRFLSLGRTRLQSIDSEYLLPGYEAEYTVDAIVSMVKALAATPMEFWNDGATVAEKLRELDFEGLSGRVSFTDEGDRKDPVFSIVNFNPNPINGSRSTTYYDYNNYNYSCTKKDYDWVEEGDWVEVGTAQNFYGSAKFGDSGIRGLCFAGVGCGILDAPPNYSPPIPREKVEGWVPLVMFLMCLVFGTTFGCYRSKEIQASIDTERDLNDFKNNMCTSAELYVPKLDDLVLTSQDMMVMIRHTLNPPPPSIHWCWKEYKAFMYKWSDDEIEGNRTDCWIKYDIKSSLEIEDSFRRHCLVHKLNDGYTINFTTSIQTNNHTKFGRHVKRVVEEKAPNNITVRTNVYDFSNDFFLGWKPPVVIANEPQMILVPGDVVKISKKLNDDWAYGTKLHLEDEPLGRRLVQLALITCNARSSNNDPNQNGDGGEDKKAIITNNHGWFPMAATRATGNFHTTFFDKILRGEGNLSVPNIWDRIVDPSVVQKSAPLHPTSEEYQEVSSSFLSTLKKTTKIVSIQRIQNVALYQSYIVKRKTFIDRDKILYGSNFQFQHALARFERRWLWHGTNADSIERIIQQGFNRSLCGKNMTAFGKGVYFARDASYSAADMYSPKDSSGNKYILACSVVVGEFCKGCKDAWIPDLRDATKNILYDSTVDNTISPRLYVTYHDAQCYPDYIIVFK